MTAEMDEYQNSEDFIAFQQKVHGTNISEQTLLATDYLNHFNEVVMMIDMIADMPDCLDMAREWQPKTYQEHFRDSTFSDKELAIEAYDHVPPIFKERFEQYVEKANKLVAHTLDSLEAIVNSDDPEHLRFVASESSQRIQRMLDVVNAVIHGSSAVMDQEDIDELLETD